MSEAPDFILFAQHGWADTHKEIATMAKILATPQTLIIAPNLGWFRTWLRIEPLIDRVEEIASQILATYPDTPIRIMGHSMGGLIWLEVLSRHPEWWPQVESFVLIASPVGGADLARFFDPFGMGIGIAGALGVNRRKMAKLIAKTIPTLVIAGDIDGGSDGTITVETTKFGEAKFVSLLNLHHAKLKNHPAVVDIIREFWANPVITECPPPDFVSILIERLQSIPGIMDAHRRDFRRAKTCITFPNGLTIRTWRNPLGVDHVFIADCDGQCLYSGFVGLIHVAALRKVLKEIQEEFQNRDEG
ncbi:MAG TPA: lysophospholipase [Cyanobacteria bacterium UBA8803]|nr:lysophospholipase [Cyanobacteria bacterium UBA8803]